MTITERLLTQMLAEIIRLQRWAGGDAVAADRIIGLLYGFESVLDDDDTFGISRETEERVEKVLEDVEAGEQSAESLEIKNQLRNVNVSESDAYRVMQFCLLQSRFIDGIRKIARARGSRFASLMRFESEEHHWRGAIHHVELFDTTMGARKKLHGAFTAAIPRVGEIIVPENGSTMRVVAVEYVVTKSDEYDAAPYLLLMPHVILEAVDED